MESKLKKRFDIEMEFPPELFWEKSSQNSFYDDESVGERVPASGSFRVPPSPLDK